MIVSSSSLFSGSEGTFFRVEMLNDAGTSWKWSKKVLIGGWDAYTTVTDYDLDTPIELALGVKVEFVQSAKSDYNDGDYWIWIMTVDMKLDSDENGVYSNLKVIENGDKRNLIMLNKVSGDIVEIKDFESTSPEINENIVNIGQSDSLDICSKNKEIFIARGEKSVPKWVGYTKNNGFSPPNDSASIISDDAYRVLDVEGTFTKLLDDFVTLRGTENVPAGSAGTGYQTEVLKQMNSRIVVGIKYGEDRLYVCHIGEMDASPPTGIIYSYKLSHMPLRIRLDYSTFMSTGQKYTTGVAVMTVPASGNYINSMEFWEIPSGATTGPLATKSKTIHFKKPADFNVDDKGFSDFLIVPNMIDYTHGSCKFYGFFSFKMTPEETNNGLLGQKCLYRVESITSIADDGNVPETILTAEGTDGRYIACTPKLDYEDSNATTETFIDINIDDTPNPDPFKKYDGSLLKIIETSDINLAIGGYDSGGLNPYIHFTANLKPSDELGYVGSEHKWGPFWIDSDEKLWTFCTVTFVVALPTTTTTLACPILVHFKHLNIDTDPGTGQGWEELTNKYNTENPVASWFKASLANEFLPPATYPLFSTPDEGRKYNVYGDVDNNNGARRALSYYNAENKQICTFAVPAQETEGDSDYLWDSANIWVFPNPTSLVYTRFTSASDGVEESRPVTSLYTLSATDSFEDKKRYRLGDNDLEVKFRYANVDPGDMGQIGLPWESEASQVIMAPITGEGDSTMSEHWYNEGMNAGADKDVATQPAVVYTGATDEMASTDTWLSFGDTSAYSSLSWVAGSAKKSFYKMSLIYDGYQESSLLNTIVTFSNSTAFTDGIQFEIRIDAEYSLPKRINAIAVYRGDSATENNDNPDGFYRFVKEIPLTDFAYDSANSRYTYTLLDDGDTEGSYTAINGIPETMTSLSINYTYCTEQNGYMFIGKCNHKEFGDANNVIFRSQPGKYSIFNWSTDFAQIPFNITALIGFMGKIYVFGYTEMAIINPETLVIEDTIKGIGCVGPKTIYTTSTGLYWFDESNIYSASPRITKIGQSILSVDTHGWYNLSSDVKRGAVGGFDVNRQAYLVFFTTGSDKRCWAYSTMMNRWDLWETAGTVMDTEQSSDGHCILLLKDGRICKYLAGANRRSWEWESKKITFGSDTIFKKVRVAKIDASNRANTSIKYQTDISTEASGWQAGTNNSNNYGSAWLGNSIKIDSAHSKARWAKFQLKGTNDSAGSDYKGYSLGVIFKPKRPK